MRRKVVWVEVCQIEHTFPLASAYMHNFARRYSQSASQYDFAIRPFYVGGKLEQIVGALTREAADIYMFSCYVWNMRRIRQVIAALRTAVPRASFVLGGPQVLNSAHLFVEAHQSNTFVCNGEGEPTARDFLDQFASEKPDWTKVPGMSWYADGELQTTAPAPQVDLDSIPSPYLESPFDDSVFFTQNLWETNRGCPFHCTFCVWGQLQDEISKFNLDRLKAEIEWMARRQYMSLHICDANWGMLERDLELAEHLARCRRDHGVPFLVIASHIKNQPERVIKMAEVFRAAGINANTTSALQSVHDKTLVTIKRRNTSVDMFVRYQQALRDRGLGSYAEVIWPLPEETLESFTAGLANLARLRMGSVNVYPLQLLNNTEMNARREEHGFVTLWEQSETQEMEWVIATKDVTVEECQDGFWFYLAFFLLYNARALYYTLHYVYEKHGISYEETLWRFVTALKASESELGKFARNVIVHRNPTFDGTVPGTLASHVWQGQREQFSRFLVEVYSKERWWQDPTARALFELDQLARPFPFQTGGDMRFVVPLDGPVFDWLRDNIEVGQLNERSTGFMVLDHMRDQLRDVAGRSAEKSCYYIQALMENVRAVSPRISSCDAHGRIVQVA